MGMLCIAVITVSACSSTSSDTKVAKETNVVSEIDVMANAIAAEHPEIQGEDIALGRAFSVVTDSFVPDTDQCIVPSIEKVTESYTIGKVRSCLTFPYDRADTVKAYTGYNVTNEAAYGMMLSQTIDKVRQCIGFKGEVAGKFATVFLIGNASKSAHGNSKHQKDLQIKRANFIMEKGRFEAIEQMFPANKVQVKAGRLENPNIQSVPKALGYIKVSKKKKGSGEMNFAKTETEARNQSVTTFVSCKG